MTTSTGENSADLYAVLEIADTASNMDIKGAFRRLAHTHHPDHGGDAERLKRIVRAYEILGDAAKRAEYDQRGARRSAWSGVATAEPTPDVSVDDLDEDVANIWIDPEILDFGMVRPGHSGRVRTVRLYYSGARSLHIKWEPSSGDFWRLSGTSDPMDADEVACFHFSVEHGAAVGLRYAVANLLIDGKVAAELTIKVTFLAPPVSPNSPPGSGGAASRGNNTSASGDRDPPLASNRPAFVLAGVAAVALTVSPIVLPILWLLGAIVAGLIRTDAPVLFYFVVAAALVRVAFWGAMMVEEFVPEMFLNLPRHMYGIAGRTAQNHVTNHPVLVATISCVIYGALVGIMSLIVVESLVPIAQDRYGGGWHTQHLWGPAAAVVLVGVPLTVSLLIGDQRGTNVGLSGGVLGSTAAVAAAALIIVVAWILA